MLRATIASKAERVSIAVALIFTGCAPLPRYFPPASHDGENEYTPPVAPSPPPASNGGGNEYLPAQPVAPPPSASLPPPEPFWAPDGDVGVEKQPQFRTTTVKMDRLRGASGPDEVPVSQLIYKNEIFFDSDDASLKPEAIQQLNALAQRIVETMPDVHILVLGHTDSRPPNRYPDNVELSRQRENAVIQWLLGRGVDIRHIEGVAIGSSQPIASNLTDAGRAENRRVEILISTSEGANRLLISERPIDGSLLRSGLGGASPKPDIRVPIIAPNGAGTIEVVGNLPLAKPSPVEEVKPARAMPPDPTIPIPIDRAKPDPNFVPPKN